MKWFFAVRLMIRVMVLAAGCILGTVSSAAANSAATSPLIVKDDRGGLLKSRYLQIDSLYRSGREVRIVGPRCESSCTLYLGLENICIASDVQFGFHGPSLYGVLPLGKSDFEELSVTMAGFYPEPVRTWFLKDARHSRFAMSYLTGDYLISLGYRECV